MIDRDEAIHELYSHRKPPFTPEEYQVRVRMQRLLGWLTRPEWLSLSDAEFVAKLFEEYQKHSGRCLVDPAE